VLPWCGGPGGPCCGSLGLWSFESLRGLKVKSAYLDGELCALNSEGVPVLSRLQAAMDEGKTDQLVFFAFDLLFLDGVSFKRS